jgi:prepilin-type N-terminal cleavage/methylation domain-containing protein
MKKRHARQRGFTLIEIMIVVAIIGLLAAIAIPNFVNATNTARRQACLTNLRYIDSAKQQWALEKRRQETDTPAGSDLQPYLGRSAGGELPCCPLDSAQTFATSYNPQTVAEKALCRVSPSHVAP